MKRPKRRLRIVDVADGPKHPGLELYDQLLARIQARQAVEGILALDAFFFEEMDKLAKSSDPMAALIHYGVLSPMLDETLSRSKAKSQERLAEFLASRP